MVRVSYRQQGTSAGAGAETRATKGQNGSGMAKKLKFGIQLSPQHPTK